MKKMKRLAIILAVLGLAACGKEKTGDELNAEYPELQKVEKVVVDEHLAFMREIKPDVKLEDVFKSFRKIYNENFVDKKPNILDKPIGHPNAFFETEMVVLSNGEKSWKKNIYEYPIVENTNSEKPDSDAIYTGWKYELLDDKSIYGFVYSKDVIPADDPFAPNALILSFTTIPNEKLPFVQLFNADGFGGKNELEVGFIMDKMEPKTYKVKVDPTGTTIKLSEYQALDLFGGKNLTHALNLKKKLLVQVPIEGKIKQYEFNIDNYYPAKLFSGR